jgi:CBS domain-containing protein
MALSQLTVAAVVKARPLTVRPDERLDIALSIMTSCRFRHLPVVENDALVGVLSIRDIYRADLSHVTTGEGTRARHLRSIEVGQAMTPDPLTAPPTMTLLTAAHTLTRRRVSCLPIVDDGKLAGIITSTDFLEPAARALEAEAGTGGAPITVHRVMTHCPLEAVAPDDPLDVAHALMRAARIRHLPVVERGRVVGILSDLDLLAADGAALPHANDEAERLAARAGLTVADAMTARPITIGPEEPAAEAARLLARRRFGALPVLAVGRLVGIVTVSDFFYALLATEDLPRRGDPMHGGAIAGSVRP